MHFAINEASIPMAVTDEHTLGEPPEATAFRDALAVTSAVEADEIGSFELAFTASELLPQWLDPYTTRRLLIARVEDRVVGRGVFECIAGDTAPEAWVSIDVLPKHRRLGIGSALLDRIEAMARAAGAEVLQGYQLTSVGDRDGSTELLPSPTLLPSPALLPSPTGFGALPLHAAGTQFALKHGYTLEQVERFSRLALPMDDTVLAAERATAAGRAGPNYRVVTWRGRTPERWLDDIALMSQRMNTDAPSAELTVTEEVWDAARVRAEDDRAEASPRTLITAAAEHVPSGRLVAFTDLSVPGNTSRSVAQEDTLVLHEHRGHRLGMLVKVANLEQLQHHYRGYPSVTTFNAEENRHMLRVNEALGFVAVGYDGAWGKTL